MSEARATSATSTSPRLDSRTFKPRRRGLSAAGTAAWTARSTIWGLAEQGPVLDLADTFEREAPSVLEIGFGNGEATISLATARPHENVIAVDVHTPGVARVLGEVERCRLSNVRVVHGDALVFVARLAPASLAGVRVFYPDPWPKRRQRHRRLIRPDVVGVVADRLMPGGTLHLATDVTDYGNEMHAVCIASGLLVGGPVERPCWRPTTRFELRGASEGRPSSDLFYRRV